MRKLASIQTIKELRPIEGADQIEVATVLGWEVVVKKGEFQVGDKVVYVEIDSILPDRPEFEFMRSRKFRVKTIKLRGQVSQGIVFPMSILPSDYPVGTDVTNVLGVVKYDPQGDEEKALIVNKPKSRIGKWLMRFAWYRRLLKKKPKGNFPSFIKKTDETRIQSMPGILNEVHKYQVTEKLDGQSATYFVKKTGKILKSYEFGVCSRNLRLPTETDSSYWDIARRYYIKWKLTKLLAGMPNELIVIQGEIIGPKIQGNKYARKQNEFYVFNVILDGKLVDLRTHAFFLDLPTVPVLAESVNFQTVTEMVEDAKGDSKLHKTPREGLVWRREGVSFKVINPDFLLKNNE